MLNGCELGFERSQLKAGTFNRGGKSVAPMWRQFSLGLDLQVMLQLGKLSSDVVAPSLERRLVSMVLTVGSPLGTFSARQPTPISFVEHTLGTVDTCLFLSPVLLLHMASHRGVEPPCPSEHARHAVKRYPDAPSQWP